MHTGEKNSIKANGDTRDLSIASSSNNVVNAKDDEDEHTYGTPRNRHGYEKLGGFVFKSTDSPRISTGTALTQKGSPATNATNAASAMNASNAANGPSGPSSTASTGEDKDTERQMGKYPEECCTDRDTSSDTLTKADPKDSQNRAGAVARSSVLTP